MVKQGVLLRELQSIAGKKHAREPKNDECSVDSLSPQAIVEPGTYEEVAEVLRFANTERLAVIPRGAGMQTTLGNIPTRYDITLGLTRLDKVIEHEPADLTVTCQAGISVGALGGLLAESEQIVPLTLNPAPADPPTVGGLLSLNTSYMRMTHGSPREFTIGLKVITADGRISRAGGKVVKNVAGYDLCKLYIGSRGTLAVIVEATFKLFPRPQTQGSVSLEFADADAACRVALQTQSRGLAVFDAHVTRPADDARDVTARQSLYLLHLTSAGDASAVERCLQEARHLAGKAGGTPFGAPLRTSAAAVQFAEHPLSVRARLLPTQVPAFIHAVESHAVGPLDASPLLGEINWLSVKGGDQRKWIESARLTASSVGGTLEVQFCSPELKRQIDVFGPPPPSFPLMRAIKQQFDPNNVLSPGRFVGRL
ncbi:MAG TPA: FAD-binding oxidoreductase [Dehalococcoidia bacterium]|nr:FAD-binding oxidoreductase [Dehalococcoidia bacterium]